MLVERLGVVALTFESGGQFTGKRLRVGELPPFEGGEIEPFVVEDRMSDGSAKDLFPLDIGGAGNAIEDGIRPRIFALVEGHAMDVIAAGLEGQADR